MSPLVLKEKEEGGGGGVKTEQFLFLQGRQLLRAPFWKDEGFEFTVFVLSSHSSNTE